MFRPFLFLLLGTLLCGTLSAQNVTPAVPPAATPIPLTPQPPPVIPRPAGTPIPLTTQPSQRVPPPATTPIPFTLQTPAPATPRIPSPTDQTTKLQFPNTDVRDVLSYYERLTGKKVIYDNTVQGTVNIVVSTPISKEEAVRIIEMSLLLNGFTLVPADRDITKVISPAKNPRTTGIPIYSDEDQIPDVDQVITFLFKLQYADPTELQQTLAQYISPQIFTSVVALPKSQALLITESTSVIRRLVKIIHEIDVPPAEVVSEFIKLERADVKDVVEKLEKIFEKAPTQGVTSAAPRVPRPPGQENQPPVPENPASNESLTKGLSEESIIVGKIKLTADVRTNRIHVVTRPVNLPFIRKLVHEFDSDVKFGEPATRKLRYVSAGDVLPVIVKAITEPGEKAEEGTQAGGTQQSRQPQQTANTGGATTSQTGGGFSVTEQLSTEPVETKPEAVTVGNTKIIADKRVNAIIVLGNAEVKEKVFKVLDQIDVRSPQVMLNTVIGELTLDKNMSVNFDYLLHFKPGSGSLTPGGSGTSVGTDSNNNAVFNTASIFSSQAFTKLFQVGSTGLTGFVGTNSLDTIVNALQSTDRFSITQRPMVFASNNKKAIIASGQEIAVPTQTLSNVVNGTIVANNTAAVSSSVEYKSVTLQLEIVPLINSEGEVSMDILQKIDSLVPGANTIVGGNSIPTIATRYIKTNVLVPDKSTVILGGLITLNKSRSGAGVPFFSRIPMLGYLFSNTTKAQTRTELLVLIQPQVTIAPSDAILVKEHEQDRLEMEPDLESTLDPPQSSEALKRAKAAKDQSELLPEPEPALRPGT